jgi:plasmid maintenance system killer protein
MALGFDEKEVEQFRAWQRTQARFDSITEEELKAEIERIDRSINNL